MRNGLARIMQIGNGCGKRTKRAGFFGSLILQWVNPTADDGYLLENSRIGIFYLKKMLDGLPAEF